MTNKILGLLFIVCVAMTAAQAQKKTGDKNPKTVRDFFLLLPNDCFEVGCCGDDTKESYLKMFLDVEDTANGYMSGNAEGGQGGFEMTLFKRPNGTYIIGFYSFGEVWDDFYFLGYRGGKWFDVSKKVVPDYSKYRSYELPRYGTTVKVYSATPFEEESETGVSQHEKLYDLEWKKGRFVIKK